MTRGVYVLVLRNDRAQTVTIGARGPMEFQPGHYIYVGSAMGTGSTSIEKRLHRHFSQKKRKHWHIDYLLEAVELVAAVWSESQMDMECTIVQAFAADAAFEYGPRGFGNSDCHASCSSHLLKFVGRDDIIEHLRRIFRSRGMKPILVP